MASDRHRAPEAVQVGVLNVAPGGVTLRVFAHTIDSSTGPLPCWTFVSDGLWSLGHKEVVLTVQRRPGEPEEAYPRGVPQLYAAIAESALGKRVVDIGGITTIATPGQLLGRPDFNCVLYSPPQTIGGVRVCAPCLTALILTETELRLSREFGMVRLMTTLGNQHRYFPTAPWVDRDRPVLLDAEGMSKSLLSRTPRVELWSSSVRQVGPVVTSVARDGSGGLPEREVTYGATRIELRLRPAARRVMQQVVPQIRPEMPLAFLVGPDPASHSYLCWKPGQQGTHGIVSPYGPGTSAAGNFMMFVAGQEEDGGVVVEDGYGMFLRKATWERIQAALADGESISVEATSGTRASLDILWLPELHPEFVETAELHAPGGWDGFRTTPRRVGDADTGPVKLENVGMLTHMGVIYRRASGGDIGDYVRTLEAVAVHHLEGATAGIGQDLVIECEIAPGGRRSFHCLVRPLSAGDPSVGLPEVLGAVEPPAVCGGPIRIQLNLTLWGGSAGDPDSWGDTGSSGG
jgi:hypothetical protein